ncbi:MAG: hypothetical protein WD795_19505 [Woeseia sp.]
MLESNCPYGDESLVVADYLAGRLSRAKTQAFEAHSFGCERCFGELQRAVEVRAAGHDKRSAEVHEQPVSRPGRIIWPSLGLAATVALALGVWVAAPLLDEAETPVEPVYRDAGDDAGGVQGLRLAVERNDDRVALDWAPVQGADQYEVRIFTEGGDPVFERQTSRTSIELSAAEWQEADPPGKFYGQVIALDELRQIIVQSGFEPL